MEYIIDELKQYDLNIISKSNLIANKSYIKYRRSNITNLCLITLCENDDYNTLLDNMKFCDVTYYTFDNNLQIEKIMLNTYLNFCKNCSLDKFNKFNNYFITYKKYFNTNIRMSFIYYTTFEHYKKKCTNIVNLNNFIKYCEKKLFICKTMNIYYEIGSNDIYYDIK
jgi:hypothetical protein